MKLICDAGHEHPLVEYASDGQAVYSKLACLHFRLYVEVHTFDLRTVRELNPDWLGGIEGQDARG